MDGTRYVKRNRQIPLTQSKVGWVSADDYDLASGGGRNGGAVRWCAWETRGIWYAQRQVKLPSGKWVHQFMHQLITITGLRNVDHINGDGLNNCRYNLRPATVSQQRYNRGPLKGGTSKYKGVSLDKDATKHRGRQIWRASIQAEGVPQHTIGRFKDELDAARAYDGEAIELHQEFAWLNCDHFGRAKGSTNELADYWHWRGRYE